MLDFSRQPAEGAGNELSIQHVCVNPLSLSNFIGCVPFPPAQFPLCVSPVHPPGLPIQEKKKKMYFGICVSPLQNLAAASLLQHLLHLEMMFLHAAGSQGACEQGCVVGAKDISGTSLGHGNALVATGKSRGGFWDLSLLFGCAAAFGHQALMVLLPTSNSSPKCLQGQCSF